MKSYADMSDNDINAAVASSLGVEFEQHESGIYVSIKRDIGNVVSITGIVDYCNNWADAGPVILENKIGIETTSSSCEWMARTCSTNMSNMMFRCSKHKNPLRAAMIVFLMMKDSETRILAPDEVSDE